VGDASKNVEQAHRSILPTKPEPDWLKGGFLVSSGTMGGDALSSQYPGARLLGTA